MWSAICMNTYIKMRFPGIFIKDSHYHNITHSIPINAFFARDQLFLSYLAGGTNLDDWSAAISSGGSEK